MRNVAAALLFLTGLGLVACASDGSFAIGKGKTVDVQVTLTRVCTGLKGMDTVFKAAGPQFVDARGVQIEADAARLLANFCDPAKPPTDLSGAVIALSGALVDLGDVLADIRQKGG